MAFRLFRVGETGPGTTVSNANVAVATGVFTVNLDFGAGVFDGTAYELAIAVRGSGSGEPFVNLLPRQPLLATPNAVHAQTASLVPDSAQSGNVPRLDGMPIFTEDIQVTTLRVTDTSGGGSLRFGPTDDCSLDIDPAFPGLVTRDPSGFRLMGQGNQGRRLIFGPTDDCSVGIMVPGTPGALTGLLLRDPSGTRLLSPNVNQPPTLRFGPTDDCSIGIDLTFSGLVARDVRGLRILNPIPNGTNTLVFGPTLDCRIEAIPGTGTNAGLRFSDPRRFAFRSQVTVSGPVFATQFIPTSSRRFKNDVKPIEQPLEKIAKLQGVRFTWSEEKGGREDIGFIAEDVGKVIPEVVSWEEDGQNARGVNYDHLVAVAIEGIKAQQSKIETLEREKTELKGSLVAIQAQLDRVTAQMQTLMSR